MKELIIRPIGHVKNEKNQEMLRCSKADIALDKEVMGTQSNDVKLSEIVIHDEYVECMDGIEDFSHLVIKYWTLELPHPN